jgi:hypothetical protein
MKEFYVVSIAHTRREHRYITVWRPENNGYAWPLSWAGRYSESRIMSSLDYYHNGSESIAVSCITLDQLAVPVIPGTVDNNAGPVVMNTKENWDRILYTMSFQPPCKPKPQFNKEQRVKEAA